MSRSGRHPAGPDEETPFVSDLVDLLKDLRLATPGEEDGGTTLQVETERLAGLAPHVALDAWPAVRTELEGLIPKLRAARVFVFDPLPPPAADGAERYPFIDREGKAIFNSGRVAPPFGCCWFEFAAHSGMRLGLLVEPAEKGAVVTRQFWWSRTPLRRNVMTLNAWEAVFRPASEELRRANQELAARQQGIIETMVEDPCGQFGRMVDAAQQRSDRLTAVERMSLLTNPNMMAVYGLLVLHSRERTLELHEPGKFANRRRSDKGLHPHPPFHRVRLRSDWRPGAVPDGPVPVG